MKRALTLMILGLGFYACGNGFSDSVPGRKYQSSLEAPFGVATQSLSDDSIKIVWSNPNVDGVYQIGIEKREILSTNTSIFTQVALVSQTQEYTVTSLLPNTSYEFRLYIATIEGKSDYAIVSGTTLAGPGSGAPDPINTPVTITLTNASSPYEVTLHWTHADPSSVDYYFVTKRENNTQKISDYSMSGNGSVTLVDNASNAYFMYSGSYLGFQNGGYHYEIKACNQTANACSAAVVADIVIQNAGTIKPAISTFSATQNVPNQVDLTWSFTQGGSWSTATSIALTRNGLSSSLYSWSASSGTQPSSGGSASDTSATPGTSYTYTLTINYTDGSSTFLNATGKAVSPSVTQMSPATNIATAVNTYKPNQTSTTVSWKHSSSQVTASDFVIKLVYGGTTSIPSASISYNSNTQTFSLNGYQINCPSVASEYDVAKISIQVTDPNNVKTDSNLAYSADIKCYNKIPKPVLNTYIIMMPIQGSSQPNHYNMQMGFSYYNGGASVITFSSFNVKYRIGTDFNNDGVVDNWGGLNTLSSSAVTNNGSNNFEVNYDTTCASNQYFEYQVQAVSTQSGKSSDFVTLAKKCP
ncbi:MAG: fibronectin type III domain-containing protein [Bdellovibrionota bacterium]